MKKSLMTAFLALSALSACNNQSDVPATNTAAYPEATIGVSISSIATNPFFQGMYASFEEVGKEHAGLKVLLSSADNQQAMQNTQLEEAIKHGAKALVINLADVSVGSEIVSSFCARKIPVVYINRHPGEKALANCDIAYMVDGDAVQGGVLQGLLVLEQWKANSAWDKNKDGKIQYAMLEGIPGHAGAMARTQWSISTMATYPNKGVPVEKIFQDTAMFQTEKAEEVVSEWIKHPEFASVEVLLANNDSMALGAANVFKKHPENKVPIFGIDAVKDALNAVKTGDLAGTVYNDYDTQARVAVRMAANLAAGKDAMSGLDINLDNRMVKIPYAEAQTAQ